MKCDDHNPVFQDFSAGELNRFLLNLRQALAATRKAILNIMFSLRFSDLNTLLYEDVRGCEDLDFRERMAATPPESVASHRRYRNMVRELEKLIRIARECVESPRKGNSSASQFAVFLHQVFIFNQSIESLFFGITSTLSDVDALTGLLNRSAMECDFSRASMSDCRVFSLAMLDIDHFKRINDTYGHAFGDRVLETFADCLIEYAGPSDKVYRYGGEEFLILFPDTPLQKAIKSLELIRKKTQNLKIDGTQTQSSISIGATEVFDGDFRQATIRADGALYQAKQKGRNRIELA